MRAPSFPCLTLGALLLYALCVCAAPVLPAGLVAVASYGVVHIVQQQQQQCVLLCPCSMQQQLAEQPVPSTPPRTMCQMAATAQGSTTAVLLVQRQQLVLGTFLAQQQRQRSHLPVPHGGTQPVSAVQLQQQILPTLAQTSAAATAPDSRGGCVAPASVKLCASHVAPPKASSGPVVLGEVAVATSAAMASAIVDMQQVAATATTAQQHAPGVGGAANDAAHAVVVPPKVATKAQATPQQAFVDGQGCAPVDVQWPASGTSYMPSAAGEQPTTDDVSGDVICNLGSKTLHVVERQTMPTALEACGVALASCRSCGAANTAADVVSTSVALQCDGEAEDLGCLLLMYEMFRADGCGFECDVEIGVEAAIFSDPLLAGAAAGGMIVVKDVHNSNRVAATMHGMDGTLLDQEGSEGGDTSDELSMAVDMNAIDDGFAGDGAVEAAMNDDVTNNHMHSAAPADTVAAVFNKEWDSINLHQVMTAGVAGSPPEAWLCDVLEPPEGGFGGSTASWAAQLTSVDMVDELCENVVWDGAVEHGWPACK